VAAELGRSVECLGEGRSEGVWWTFVVIQRKAWLGRLGGFVWGRAGTSRDEQGRGRDEGDERVLGMLLAGARVKERWSEGLARDAWMGWMGWAGWAGWQHRRGWAASHTTAPPRLYRETETQAKGPWLVNVSAGSPGSRSR
jgi:hypothetical protein